MDVISYANVVNADPTLKIPCGVPYPQQRIGEQGDEVVNMHGEMAEACRIGSMFYVSIMDTGKVTTIDLAGTYTGLCLSNPAGNNKKLVIRAVGHSIEAIGAAATSVFLAGGYSVAGVVTHTTPLVAGTDFGSLRLGGSELPTALADSAATIVNPRHLMVLGTTAATVGSQQSVFSTGGAPVVLPGGWVAVTTSIVTAAAGIYIAFWWEEVPL